MTKNKVWTCEYLLLVGLVLNARGNEIGPNGPYFAAVLENDSNNTTYNNETDILERGKDLVDEALIPVYDMTNFFLEDIVQPHDLNYMAERGVDFSDLDAIVDSFENDYEEWIEYGIGYPVCAAIGVVLLVVMTLGGLLICCCRTCCGNCGGKVDPRESSNAGCKRGCCGFFLFIVISVVLLGSLAMFFTAVRVHDELYRKRLSDFSDEDVFHSIADGVDTMGKYVNDTLDELEDGTLGVYNKTTDEVFLILDTVVNSSYTELDTITGITANLEPLLEFTQQMPHLNATLSNVQSNVNILQTNITDLDMELESITDEIITAIETNCSTTQECIDMMAKVNNTSVNVNFSNFDNIYSDILLGLQVAIETNLSSNLENGYEQFQEIITTVDSEVSADIDAARNASDDVVVTIKDELNKVEEDVGSVDFDGVGDDLREISNDDMKFPAYVTFWSLVGFASVLALIVLLTYLGLLFSCCPRADRESDYCCTRKMAATCLLSGVGIAFIFFWILLLVLIPMFLTGGLTQTEICRHLVALDESPISGIINDLVNATFYEDTDFSINITEIYTSCKENEAFYTALDVENTFGFDLDTLLDTEAIDDQINNIRNTTVDIGQIEILNNDSYTLLTELGSALENSAENTKNLLAELQKNVTTTDLGVLVQELRDLAENVSGDSWMSSIDELESLYNGSVTEINTLRKDIFVELAGVQDLLTENITAITIGLYKGQNITNEQGNDIVQGVINSTATEVENIIDYSIEEIENNVRYEIGKCKPVYNAVATIVDSACIELLYALNGYWFALGWSLFFLLISIILSFKLSSMYRKTMDHDETIPQVRREGRTPRHQRHQNTDSTVLIVRRNSHEMTPVNNPVYSLDGQKIPRPQLKQGIAVYPEEMTHIVGRPPSYSESQFIRK